MNRTKKSVGILSSTTIILVYVRNNIPTRRTPEALKEAKNLRRLGNTVAASLSERNCQIIAVHQCPMLSGNCEERGPIYFFPQVIAGLIPEKCQQIIIGHIIGILTNIAQRSLSRSE
jgi:hypothetical protein